MKCVTSTELTRPGASVDFDKTLSAESDLVAVVADFLADRGYEQSRGLFYRIGKASFRPDFVVRAASGARIAIDVPGTVDARLVHVLFAWYDEARRHGTVDGLLLVTPDTPAAPERELFADTFDQDPSADWVGIADFSPTLRDLAAFLAPAPASGAFGAVTPAGWSPWTWHR